MEPNASYTVNPWIPSNYFFFLHCANLIRAQSWFSRSLPHSRSRTEPRFRMYMQSWRVARCCKIGRHELGALVRMTSYIPLMPPWKSMKSRRSSTGCLVLARHVRRLLGARVRKSRYDKPWVLSMDCIYKTNRYKMSLLDTVGCNSIHVTSALPFSVIHRKRHTNLFCSIYNKAFVWSSSAA